MKREKTYFLKERGIKLPTIFDGQHRLSKLLSEVKFTPLQKKFMIEALMEGWKRNGDSTHWEGIKMAKRIIRKL
jgi:hypothetical protein